MASYKVLQDIEAEDKLLGPLSLKQFIFASIAAISLYLCFFSVTKHASFLIVIFLPLAIIAGFLAWPWSRDQPTEIWLLAKIRFYLKPRRRIWNQDGIQQLVTITAPKKLEEHLTNDLSQTEVKSRLKALAETIDSRGWAIKNINVNLYDQPQFANQFAGSDRLIDLSSLPQEVSSIDVAAADDMMDERNNPVAHQLDEMIGASTQQHHEQLMKSVQAVREKPATTASTPTAPPNTQDLWFMQPGGGQTPPGYSVFNSQVVPPATTAATQLPPLTTPSMDEQAILAQLHADDSTSTAAYGHLKVIDPKGKKRKKAEKTTSENNDTQPKAFVPPSPDPAIINLANNDDLNVATIAREANKKRPPEDEVVIPLR